MTKLETTEVGTVWSFLSFEFRCDNIFAYGYVCSKEMNTLNDVFNMEEHIMLPFGLE